MKAALVNAAMVGSGGFLGALARYGISGLVHRQLPLTTFPYGTLAVNLIGCFAVGALAGLAEVRQLFGPELRTFALIGLLGGFTTFSTFSLETLNLIEEGAWLKAGLNAGLSLVLCIGAAWLGVLLARQL